MIGVCCSECWESVCPASLFIFLSALTETLNEEDKAKMSKIKKKMKQKVQRGECQPTNQGQVRDIRDYIVG